MAKIDLTTITEPLADEQPCGPDLDMEFDMDFMNLVAEVDGRIPTAFFSFDPGAMDFAGFYDRIADLLGRTRDLRVLVPLAKLRILQSDLPGFAEALDAIHRLLKERWADLHPQPADFLELGMGQLATLDDMPNVVLPLQHTQIVRSRRAGPITLRRWQVAAGEINPRDGEEVMDPATITAALAEADPDELGRSHEALLRARDAVAGIRAVCIQEAGFDQAPEIERLPAALDAAIALIERATGGSPEADGDQAGAGEPGDVGAAATAVVRLPSGAVATREQAVEAMHVAARYFALHEPSSPVPILLREAQTASGKSFYELVSDLVPDSAGSAFVALGSEPWFEVYLSTLDSRNPPPEYEAEAEDGEEIAEDAGLGDPELDEEGAPDDAPEPDRTATEDTGDTSGTEETEPDEAGEPEADEAAAGDSVEEEVDAGAEPDADAEAVDAPVPDDEEAAGSEQAADDGDPGEPPAEPPDAVAAAEPAAGADAGAPRRRFVANSRPEAVALLRQVLEYYRVAEPSSPVPLLVERAIEMSSKSFIELLGSVLPDGSLKVKPKDGEY